jgi:hypothetical protein
MIKRVSKMDVQILLSYSQKRIARRILKERKELDHPWTKKPPDFLEEPLEQFK